MSVDYDRDRMLKLINHDTTLSLIYLDRCKRYRDPKLKWDQVAVDRAIRELFDERIADPVSYKLYERAWSMAAPTPYVYDRVPEYDKLTTHIQILANIHGWRGVMLAFTRFANIKEAEMQNGGFASQRERWAKMSAAFKKMASSEIMT